MVSSGVAAEKTLLGLYSFDYSAGKPPLGYETLEQTVNLPSKTKLITPVKDRLGLMFIH